MWLSLLGDHSISQCIEQKSNKHQKIWERPLQGAATKQEWWLRAQLQYIEEDCQNITLGGWVVEKLFLNDPLVNK